MAGPDTVMSRHYPESIETKKGHMKGARQGIRSTKTKPKANIADDGTIIKIEGGANAPPETPHTKENYVLPRNGNVRDSTQ